jgi:hypothetical protein
MINQFRRLLRPVVPVLAAVAAVAVLSAGPAAGQATVADAPPQPGATPAVAASGSTIPGLPTAGIWYTGTDGHAYVVGLPAPTNATGFGGRLVGGPGTAFVPPGSLNGTWVFGRGTDNALWQALGSSAGHPNQWRSYGGQLTSSPGVAAGALAVTGGESIDVVARGTDAAVWDREVTSAATRPWISLGGRMLAGTAPAAVNTGGTVYVLAVGTDHALWATHSSDGVHWSGWQSLGGKTIASVGAATPAPGAAVAVVRGTDNAAWYLEFAGTTPGVGPGWHSLGGVLTSGVNASAAPGGMTWVVTLGTDSHIWQASGTWPALHWSKAW